MLDSAIAYEDRGMQALKTGDFAAAAKPFARVSRSIPTPRRFAIGSALRFRRRRRFRRGAEFSAVAKRSPEFAKAHFSLGAIYDATGRRREAIDEYRAAVEADRVYPKRGFAWPTICEPRGNSNRPSFNTKRP